MSRVGWAALFAVGCSNVEGISVTSAGDASAEATGASESSGGEDSGEIGDSSAEASEGGYMTIFDLASPPEAECNPWVQDCADGEKCTWRRTVDAWEPVCVPLAAEVVPVDSPCLRTGPLDSGLDNCALAALCNFTNDQGEGVCSALCSGSPEQPVCNGQAAVCQDCAGDCPPLCLIYCDPLMSDCPSPLVCLPLLDGFSCGYDNSMMGSGGIGDPCDYSDQCGGGTICVDAKQVPACGDAQGCCAEICDLSKNNTCPDGLVCTPYDPNAEDQWQDVGVCIYP